MGFGDGEGCIETILVPPDTYAVVLIVPGITGSSAVGFECAGRSEKLAQRLGSVGWKKYRWLAITPFEFACCRRRHQLIAITRTYFIVFGGPFVTSSAVALNCYVSGHSRGRRFNYQNI